MQSSLAVVAESARRVFVFPSMKVMGSINGFFDFVACGAEINGGLEMVIHVSTCGAIG